ncbi:MAG: glycosyltransferase family 2 protein [Cyclobacteriaceae bacterium]|nr:glycosyltransferase family 2 protein [Cyclobacteriaceae bacterium]
MQTTITSNSVAIIIVNWNSFEYTSVCIQSLQKVQYDSFTILVVDNGSEDQSSLKIAHEFPEVVMIRNEKNLGFTGGNNRGIQWALERGFPYIMLLNNDTEVHPGFLYPLVEKIKESEEVGAVQPKMYFMHDKKRIWNAGGRFYPFIGKTATIGYNVIDSGQFEAMQKVDWITGCCILVSSRVIREVGLLDDRFFAYYEDVDWSFRIRESGKSLWFVPQSFIYHVAGASSTSKVKGKEGYLSAFAHYLNVRNNILLIRKHDKLIFRIPTFVFQLFKVMGYLVYFIARRRWGKFRAVLKGVSDGMTK